MPRHYTVFISAIFLAHFTTPAVHAQALGCTPQSLQLAQQQLSKTLGYVSTSQFAQLTVPPANRWNSVAATDWTSGFFPGWIWYMYEQQLDPSLLTRAQAQTSALAGEATDASGHDIGFRIMTSYGNGYQVTRNPAYMTLIQTAAQTMSTLYQPGPGVINSWPYYNSAKTTVIIDDMVSLELLFYAAQNGGNSAWYNMAVSHALQTMKNNVRPDGSTYQGVEYNSDGTVYLKFTADGFSTNSTWARGQAWGIYGFTMAYRYTRDARFLATAQLLADYYINHAPPDYVPYWDFALGSPAPRDTSAAAIAAAGMLELSTYMTDPLLQSKYLYEALYTQTSLSNPALYLANPSANPTDGILLHGTYSFPFNVGIDTSLIWGDYYFLQGCYRAMSPPAQVTGLSAAAPASNQVALTWSAQSGAIRYTVKRSTVAGGPYTIVAPPPVLTASTFTDTSVAPYTTYYYVVSASSVAGEGQNSAEVKVTTPAGTPTATALRSSLNPSASGQTVRFTANVSPSAATGTVQFLDGSNSLGTVTLSGGAASLSTSTLSVGPHSLIASYKGDSNFSGSNSATLTQIVNSASGLPGTPGAPTFTNVGSTSLTVNWTAASGATSYVVWRKPGTSGAWSAAGSTTTALSFNDSGLTAGALYTYEVIAWNSSGQTSSPDTTVTTTAASGLPGAPGAPAFTNVGSTSLTVNWTAASGAASYVVWRKPGSSGTWSAAGSTTTALSFNDSGLTPGTLYTYEIIALNPRGQTSSPDTTVTTAASSGLPGVPGAPAFTNVGSTSLTVSWTAASGATSYAVWRKTGTSGTWSQIGTTTTALSFNDSGLTPGTLYTYEVIAVNSKGQTSSPDTTVTTASASGLPGAPGAPAFTNVGRTSITVNWTAASGATSYVVWRKPGTSGAWSAAGSTTTALSFNDSGLAPGTLYTYEVIAWNSRGQTSSPDRTVTTAP